jgi:Domain of unknown function (DUF4760)
LLTADRIVRVFVFLTFLAFAVSVLSAALWQCVSWLYAEPSADMRGRLSSFTDLGGFLVALLGVVAAIATFLLSAQANRHAQRRQHTFTMLLETRLSSEFRETMQRRRAVFPEYMDLTFEDWDQARRADARHGTEAHRAEARHMNEGAWALISLLNYYEFLALGIESGDLDEPMLRRSVRGIMCSLVDDARHVIAQLRRNDPKTYANLAMLYDRWRVEGARDIDGKPNERPIPSL